MQLVAVVVSIERERRGNEWNGVESPQEEMGFPPNGPRPIIYKT